MGRRSYRMSRRRHTPEQVVRKLREADRLLSEGSGLPEVLKHLEIAEATYHRWRNQYRWDEGRRCEALEGARGREPEAQADRRGPGARYPGAEGAVGGETSEPGRGDVGRSWRFRNGSGSRSVGRAGLAGQHRSTQRHVVAVVQDDAVLRAELRAFSRERPRWGYRQAHQRLLDAGLVRSTASGSSGCGARKGCGCRPSVANAAARRLHGARATGCAPSGPITSGRSTSSST